MNIRRLIFLPINLSRYLYFKLTLGSYGRHSKIVKPLRINGGKSIYIGKHVFIQYKTWLASEPRTENQLKSKLIIEDGCTIGHFNHIYATKSIILHKNVLTADKVYISDNMHGYEDLATPIMKQPIVQRNTVEIGEGSWLGENVCIIGSSIGKHCVIGANAVVTKDIPDYSVAVGAPAYIIKRYDEINQIWRKTNKAGL